MRNKKLIVSAIIFVILIISVFVVIKIKGKGVNAEITKEISPVMGSIQTFISTITIQIRT